MLVVVIASSVRGDRPRPGAPVFFRLHQLRPAGHAGHP